MAQDWTSADVFVLDVEGTLVDAVVPTLCCWRETLLAFGHDIQLDALHRLTGLDGKLMLAQLLPGVSACDRETMIKQQGTRYRDEFLPQVKPFPGVRALFEELKRRSRGIALATDCQKDELRHYLHITGVGDLVDAFACGDDVECGKPAPDLVRVALERIDAIGKRGVMVGDTAFDAEAARDAGIAAVGVLTGHIAEEALRAAGCETVLPDVTALHAALPR
jgi:phosphoglycolate phosphatase-like HAD superfamily hydrolase